MQSITLAEAIAERGVEVLAHLDRQVTIPIVAGPQAQGDLAILPLAMVDTQVRVRPAATWVDVPAHGVEVLRGAAMGNPHTLLAAPGSCQWTTRVNDAENLALGVLDASEVAYLAHPEHGYAGIAPGRYVIRRQREQREMITLVAD